MTTTLPFRQVRPKPVTAVSRWWLLTNAPFYLIFWIALSWIAVISVYRPSVMSLYEPTFTFGNYHRIFTDSSYYVVLWDTLWMALVGSALSVVVAFPLAYHISRRAGRLRSTYIGMLITLLLVAFIIKLYAWQILLNERSPIAVALASVGAPASLLGTKAGVIVGLVYASLPYSTLSILASVDQVPRQIEEAAACFGSGPRQVFTSVVLPMAGPGIATALVFAIPLNLSAFLAPLLLGRGKVQMTALQIYTSSASGGIGSNWPVAAALSISLLVGCVVFTLLALRLVAQKSRS